MPSTTLLLIAAVAVVVVFIVIAGTRHFGRGWNNDPLIGLVWRVIRLYVRLVHRVTYHGLEHVPSPPGALVIVSNHTGGVDPLLIQAAIPAPISWLMAREYMSRDTLWFWKRAEMIPVNRTGRDAAATRIAIRRVRGGQAIGVFPEGGIANPPQEIRPFMPGISFLVAKCRAPVLLVWVHGTPKTTTAMKALTRFSRAHVHFLGLYHFDDVGDPNVIGEMLRIELARASGWPLNDDPLPTARKATVVDRDPFAA